MINELVEILKDKKVLILGFGKEGRSSYQLISKYIPEAQIAIADQNETLDLNIDPDVRLYLGSTYLERINEYDLIIKAPGVPAKILQDKVELSKVTSQTALFIRIFSRQIIGITGTKGKSTTASLIKHIISSQSNNVILVGNIGIPPFDLINEIDPATWIVFELSSHQLQDINSSPHIAILLNLFEEHLDHYADINAYHLAKLNITKFQKHYDWLIVNKDDGSIEKLLVKIGEKAQKLPYSLLNKLSEGAFVEKEDVVKFIRNNQEVLFEVSNRKSLAGDHNLMNILAAICACKIVGIPDSNITGAINSFIGLRHRMEYVGKFKGIHFYNDSIATIPEATINAIKTLKKVDTLILGGKDRGIDYQLLLDYLPESGVRNFVFIGNAGKRIMDDLNNDGKLKDRKMFFINSFNELSKIIRQNTLADHICLLSPAASSYDMFLNFEERGDAFKKIAENL